MRKLNRSVQWIVLTALPVLASSTAQAVNLIHDGHNGVNWSTPDTISGPISFQDDSIAPSAISRGRAFTDVFSLGRTDHKIWTTEFNGVSWSAPAAVATAAFGSEPAAASLNATSMDVFAASSDLFNIMTSHKPSGGAWTAPTVVPGPPGNKFQSGYPPAVVARAQGTHLTVVAIQNTTHDLWFNDLAVSWGNWRQIPGRAQVWGKVSLATAPLNGATVYLVARDFFDNSIWFSSFDGISWSNLVNLGGGSFDADPAVAAYTNPTTGATLIAVMTIRTQGTLPGLYENLYNGAVWSGFNKIQDGTFFQTPAVVSAGPNMLDVFVANPSSMPSVRHCIFDGVIWQNEDLMPITPASGPSAVVASGGHRLDVFVKQR